MVIDRSSQYLSSRTIYKHARKQRKAVIVIENSDRETFIMYSPLTTIMKNAKNKDRKPENHRLCLTQRRLGFSLFLLAKFFLSGSPMNLLIALCNSANDSSYTPFLQTIYCKGNKTIITDFSYSESSIRTGSICLLYF